VILRTPVLVADDDPAVSRYLRRNLSAAGYEVRECAATTELLLEAIETSPDLLILGLDGASGAQQLISGIRQKSGIPIIVLSERADEASLVAAIESGADDYLRKPFGIRELLARLHGLLRHAVRQRGASPLFMSGNLEVDLVRRKIRLHRKEVHLPIKPYEVLRILVENADKVVSYEDIVTQVWGSWSLNRRPYARMAIREIRRAIEDNPRKPVLIVNEPDVGYRLRALTEAPASQSSEKMQRRSCSARWHPAHILRPTKVAGASE